MSAKIRLGAGVGSGKAVAVVRCNRLRLLAL
jgi:hypothetical protein